MTPDRPARVRAGRRMLLALVLALVPASSISAQADPAAVPADSTVWRATGELSLTDVSGNKDLSLFATGFKVEHRSASRYSATANVSARYGRSNGDLAAKSALGGLELRLRPKAVVSPFATLLAERDDVRRLLLRAAGSVGVDVNLLSNGTRRFSVGGAILQDFERRDPVEGDLTDATVSRTRLTARLNIVAPIREGVTLEHESRIEPATVDFSDYLLRTRTAFRVLVSQRLSLQTTLLYDRDNDPPEGVAFKDDRTLTVGLVVELTPPTGT